MLCESGQMELSRLALNLIYFFKGVFRAAQGQWRTIAIVVMAMFIGLRAEGKTVVIDAGHGGWDRGGVPGQRVPEKIVALDVAQRVQRALKGYGYSTVMTRNSDVFVPLGTRVAIGNRYRGALFLSVHFNSASRVGAQGFETFYYGASSVRIARRIQSKLLGLYRTENRGTKRRGFYVLRRTSGKAVLVECGFLTNPTESRLALQASHRQRLAEAIASAVRETF